MSEVSGEEKAKTVLLKKPSNPPGTIIKSIGGEKNGGQRIVKLVRSPRYYPTEDFPRRKRKVGPRKEKKTPVLRKSITPGTILIILAGVQRGKRVIFLKQLKSGLLLVTGPYKVNHCPLRRVNQAYVIATQTKIDISGIEIPEHINDDYFKRVKPPKSKNVEAEIFETKHQEYKPSEQRKQDQVEMDKAIIAVLKKHPKRRLLFLYLNRLFTLKKNDFPHRMIF